IFVGVLGLEHTSSLLLHLHFAGLDGFWKPLAEIFVNNSNFNNNNSKGGSEVGTAEKLLGNMGFSPSDVGNFRSSLQMYLNEALLSWYQRLHASKVPDLDYSRTNMFLHNHYLCLV
ncbi:hypothetical protein S83_063142, partial [Arachis hypogaea]